MLRWAGHLIHVGEEYLARNICKGNAYSKEQSSRSCRRWSVEICQDIENLLVTNCTALRRLRRNRTGQRLARHWWWVFKLLTIMLKVKNKECYLCTYRSFRLTELIATSLLYSPVIRNEMPGLKPRLYITKDNLGTGRNYYSVFSKHIYWLYAIGRWLNYHPEWP